MVASKPFSCIRGPAAHFVVSAAAGVAGLQCLGPTDSDWNDKSFRVTERGCVGGRKQPAMLAGADFMQFSDATVSRRHFGIVFEKEVRCVHAHDAPHVCSCIKSVDVVFYAFLDMYTVVQSIRT